MEPTDIRAAGPLPKVPHNHERRGPFGVPLIAGSGA